MNLTETQQAAVTHRGSNLIVSASAGSGKTEVLARRCLDLVADRTQPCPLDRLLVVTFTRAAAAELRSRVGRMLREAAQRETDRDVRQHLRRQQVLIETAEIGTIDAWCGRLVREHFAETESGIDPGFEILGSEQAMLLRREIADRLFDWICTSSDELAASARNWMRRDTKPDSDLLRRMLLALNRYREHLVNPQPWFDAQHAAASAPPAELQATAERTLAAELAAECAFQLDQFDTVIDAAEDPRLVACLEEYRQTLADWRDIAEKQQEITNLATDIAAFSFPRKPPKTADRDTALHKEVKKRWFENRIKKRFATAVVARVLDNAAPTAELVRTLLALEARYDELLRREKDRRGVCEFSDVLRMALDLLGTPVANQRREPTPIARSLQQRFEHILVDEYQDTSPVQVELLRLITRDEPGRSNRFMVGDIKQSIYGFRQAEPRLFGDLIAAYTSETEEGRVLLLADSFRSHASLVATLNQLFAALFDPQLGGTAFAKEEQLAARRTEIANPTLDQQPRVELHLVATNGDNADEPDDENGGSESDDDLELERIEREARVIAAKIHDLRNRGTQVPSRGPNDQVTLRPLQLTDIAILLRSARGNAAPLANALRDAGIPAVAVGRDSILNSTEVQDIHTALTLLVNRRQDVPLAAHLRSPMVGLSPADLLTIRRFADQAPFHEAALAYAERGEDEALRDRVAAALRRLDDWAAAARVQDIPALLQRIMRDSGYEHFAAALPGGAHRVALLNALMTLATETAGRNVQGIEHFVAMLDDYAQLDNPPETPVAVSEDAVQIMTIHAAKGLEFPVVFLANTGARFPGRQKRDPLECDQQHGIGFDCLDFPNRRRLATPASGTIRHEMVQRQLEEELRLLYVAATRAREQLIVVGHATSDKYELLKAQYAANTSQLPLIARFNAGNMLEWLLMAAMSQGLTPEGSAAAQSQLSINVCDELPAPASTDEEQAEAPASGLTKLSPEDQAWLATARKSLRAQLDTSAAERPAVLSVSAVKEQATRAAEADTPRTFDPAAKLQTPAFAADTDRIDGRLVGDAYHRFLQWVDLNQIASPAAIRDELARLTASGHLAPDAAAFVKAEDIAWLGTTPLGAELVAHATDCRRETPFVCTLDLAGWDEPPILRGIIDCCFDTPDGIVLVDYKTDQVRDAADWSHRTVAYAVQMQLYALAAAAVFGRPIARAHLAFLRMQRIVDIPIDETTLQKLRETISAETVNH